MSGVEGKRSPVLRLLEGEGKSFSPPLTWTGYWEAGKFSFLPHKTHLQ